MVEGDGEKGGLAVFDVNLGSFYVTATYADVSKLRTLTGYNPRITLAEGLPRFVAWWRDWRRVR